MKKIRVPSAIVGFAFGLSLLTAPFTSHADNLFVCSGGGFDQTIKEFNSAGIGTPFASTSFGNPWGMAFDSTGSLYVTYQSYNTIEKFNSSGGVLSGSGTVFAAGIVSPWSLAFDSTGNLYVTTQSLNSGVNSTIEKYSSSGGVLSSNGTVFAAGLNAPNGLAFDSAGNLYVANTGNSTIEKFSSSGGVLSSNGTVFASLDAFGMAFDRSGNLFVSTSVGGEPVYNPEVQLVGWRVEQQ